MDLLSNPLEHLLAQIRKQVSPLSAQYIDQLSTQYCRDRLALRLIPPQEILSQEECRILEEIEARPHAPLPMAHPSLVIILKATRLCNLRCTYCNSWRSGPGQVMTFEILAMLMRSALSAPALRKLQIVWHGGEVTLLPIQYLRKALWLQERYRQPATSVDNCIQTNGTRLTPEWVEFLAGHEISVGVSADASPEVHDRRRLTKSGKGTWSATLKGIDLLRAANVPFGILAVIDEHALAMGAEAYLEQLADLDVRGVALLNALPANEPDRSNSKAYLEWTAFQDFLRDLFAIWWRSYRTKFEIRELEALVDAVRGKTHGLCIYAGNCMGKYLTVEPDGRVSACEKYVGNPDYEFGTLRDHGIAEMLSRSPQLAAAIATVDRQKSGAEAACDYYSYCHGGCPHDDLNNGRFGRASGGCCGMRALIGDIKEAVEEEEMRNDNSRARRDPVSVDFGQGFA